MCIRDRRGRGAKAVSRRSLIEIYLPTALLYALIMPAGINFAVGSIVLFPFRLVLIAAIPWLLSRARGGTARAVAADWMILASTAWYFVSMMHNRGFAQGFESGGRESLDLAVAYFIGRTCLRTPDDIRRMLRLAFPGLALVGAVFAAESISHRLLIWPLFPTNAAVYQTVQYRIGLMRAWGPFPHPILGGAFLGWFVALYWSMRERPMLKWIGMAIGLCGLFSLSSGSMLQIILALASIIYIFVSRMLIGRVEWRPLVWSMVALLIAFQLFTEAGAAGMVVKYLTLNPATGYFRLLIWQFGSQSVMDHPFFGIGYEGYTRLSWMKTQSVDNNWLLIAMRFGLPAAITGMIPALYAIWSSARAVHLLPRKDADVALAMTVTLFGAWLVGWTVYYWITALAGYMLLVGGGVSLGLNAELLNKAIRDYIRRYEMQGATAGQ